jgi:hypothetical protein
MKAVRTPVTGPETRGSTPLTAASAGKVTMPETSNTTQRVTIRGVETTSAVLQMRIEGIHIDALVY